MAASTLQIIHASDFEAGLAAPDRAPQFAAIVANNRVLKSVAMVGDDWLIVAAMTSDRADMIGFLDVVQALAPGEPDDSPLSCLQSGAATGRT